MIEIAQGAPGAGKSAAAVARALDHLCEGGVVAANFSLVDGWSDVLAHQHYPSRLSSLFGNPTPLYERSASLHRRFYRVDSLDAIKEIDPKALAVGRHKTDGAYREGQGLLLLDEAQLVFNSRKWDKNFEWIEFFTQHRKLGWNVIMIAHSAEMIDSQIRPLAEYTSTSRNLQKVKIPVVGLPFSPYPMFLVIRRYAGLGAGASVVESRRVFPLPLWAARLYDSCHVFASGSASSSSPMLCGPPPLPPSGGGGGKPSPPSRLSSLSGPHWDDYLMSIPNGKESGV